MSSSGGMGDQNSDSEKGHTDDPRMRVVNYLWRKRILRKIQIFGRINVSGGKLAKIIGNLERTEGLRYCSTDAKKMETFRLAEYPDSMLQISSKGAIIMTVDYPEAFWILYKILLNAIWFTGESHHVLTPLTARIYRVEKYPVKSREDVISLLMHQTIVGAKKE
ncbi:MAG: hypothetical protein QXF74_04630 [Nitrososphaerota archaeon]